MKNPTPRENRIREGSPVATFLLYGLAALLCFITIYPMYYVIIRSISDPILATRQSITFLPAGFYLGTYEMIVQDVNLWRSYVYTILYVVVGTILMLFTSVIGAYPLVSNKLRGRKFVVLYFLIPMYFGGGLIPSFLNNTKLGLYDNIWVMIIPGAVGLFNIILVRTFFAALPAELRESAEIDGAGTLTVLWHIYIPLSKAVLAVIAIWTIVGKWNDWFTAKVYLMDIKLQPLQMYLNRLIVEQTVDITALKNKADLEAAFRQSLSAQQMKYALIVFVTLPIILVYPMFQKYFVKGVMLGSLKG